MEYSPTKMKALLEKYDFNFKKNFGQNFIIDENIINSIINKAAIDKDTLVIEIGPGAGSLTYKLASAAKQVICYEIDTKLKDILSDTLSETDNVEVIYDDFLKHDVLPDLKKYEYSKLYVVANLPYYITTPIITRIIEKQIPVDKIVVMVQKEVGDRFKATPGSRDYGSLSVYLNYYFEIKKLLDVSKNVFMPKPNVDSIVVEFLRKDNEYKLIDENFFFQLIKASFAQKRKTIRNNLKNYDLNIVESVLNRHDLTLNARAEEISIDIFVELANALKEAEK